MPSYCRPFQRRNSPSSVILTPRETRLLSRTHIRFVLNQQVVDLRYAAVVKLEAEVVQDHRVLAFAQMEVDLISSVMFAAPTGLQRANLLIDHRARGRRQAG